LHVIYLRRTNLLDDALCARIVAAPLCARVEEALPAPAQRRLCGVIQAQEPFVVAEQAIKSREPGLFRQGQYDF
jgi:hypothetical protein